MPKISTIILTLDSMNYIKICLDSVLSQAYPDREVIVVDNGSKDGTVSFIKENYPEVILIENKENAGAAKARNQGIQISKGEWVLTLDCDCILGDDYISKFTRALNDSPSDIGIIQSKILYSDRKRIYSAGIFLSSIRRFYDIGQGSKDLGQFDKPKYIFGACSAAAFYRRQMLEQTKEDTGYFDERFFFLVEDVDLAWRAQRHGWKALYYPQSVCYHFGNSSGFDKGDRQYLCSRNRYYTIKKNEGIIKYALKVFPLLVYDLPRFILIMIRRVAKIRLYNFKKYSKIN
jgi:hypothetical protein